MPLTRGGSLVSAVLADAAMTFTLFPLVLLVFVAITAVTLSGVPLHDLMPIAFAAVAIAVSDISTRDNRAGTTAILYGAPRLRESFVVWKFSSALVVATLLLLAPIGRVATGGLASLGAMLVGIVFVAALTTALGAISGNPKTFIVFFLSFWYVVVNDKGVTPMFDFAGFYGSHTIGTTISYAAVSVGCLVAALVAHKARLQRS